MSNELYVARGNSLERPVAASTFRKAAAPRTGDHYGNWNVDHTLYRLPGGSVLQFDLDRLTLEDFRQMRTDYQINASLLVLTAMLAQSDWCIHTKGQDKDPAAKKISDTIEEGVRRYWLPLVRALSTALWSGYSPTVLVYELNDSSKYYEVTKYKDLLPETSSVRWDVKYEQNGQQILNYDGIMAGGKEIPADNTLWYPILMENGNYYGRKLLKPAFAPWYFSLLIHLYTNRYFERFGEPTAMGFYPPDETVVDEAGNAVDARTHMTSILSSLRNRGVVALPSQRTPKEEGGDLEWEIKFLESQMRGVDFDRYLNRLDEEKSLGLFTPVLMFRTGERMANALVGIQEKVFQWMLNLLIHDVKNYLDEYLIRPLHDINFSPNAPRSEIRFRTLGRLTDSGAGQVLQALIQNGGARVSQKGLRDLGDYMGVDLEYLSGMGVPPVAPGKPGAPGAGSSQHPSGGPGTPSRSGALPDPTAPLPPTAGYSNASAHLIAARKRLEEQVGKAFGSRDGFDLERSLGKVRLGYKQAFVNELSHSGVAQAEAENFFHKFETEVRDGLTAANSRADALTAIANTYADYGFDGTA